MRLRISVVSVTVLTLFFSFLVQDAVKAQTIVNICDRTDQVEATILVAINNADPPPSTPVTCSTVTNTQLAAITRLELNDRTLIDDTDDITELKAGDFAGLTGLTFLNLSGNKLTTSKLPSNIFSSLTNLEVLGLSSNDLTELPAGIFSGLTNLTGVAVGHNPNLFDPSLLTLTVTPKLISESMAVIEVAPGIPFTKVTANLTIHGGTFSGGMRTMKNVKIEQGEMQSAPFAYTADGSSTVVITLSKLRSDPENILNGFNYKTNEGYTGFELAKGYTYTLAIKGGICNRTPQVRDEIVAMINDPGQSPTPPSPLVTCATVTDTQLAAIKALRVNDPTLTDDTDDITELKAGDFAGLTGLTFLDLSGNKLTTSKLPSNIFSGLTNLEFLGLSSNDLTELPAGIFNGLTNLTGVAVGNNPNLFDSSTLLLTVTPKLISESMAVIEVAPGIPFTKVTANLTIRGGTFSDGTLTMDNVKIEQGETQSAPFAYTADGSSTVVITLSKLRSDPKNILNGFNSKTNEGYTGFELAKGDTLANSRFKLAKSDTLVIGDGICNRTPQVRDEIVAVINDPDQSPTPPSIPVRCSTVTDTQLAAITELDLSDYTPDDDADDITALQAGDFSGLTSLEALNLSGNQLSDLPSRVFDNLTNLERLWLSGNELRNLRSGVFDTLTNLEMLFLPGNELRDLRSGLFDTLTNLETLALGANQLRDLRSGLFDTLTNLETLFLEGNQLSDLPSGVFDTLTNLETLSLFGNELSDLRSGVFDTLTNLRWLLLHSNQLSDLRSGLFDNLTNLERLFLEGNQLRDLRSGVFDTLTNLETLELSNNQLRDLPDGIFSGLTNLTGVDVSGNSIDPLPLTVTSKVISNGMAVVEVAPGVPFTKVTVDLTIHGGTFSGDMRTMDDVKIVQGETQSAPFAYTADESSTAVITLSNLRSDPENIKNGFNSATGEEYTGFELAKGDTLAKSDTLVIGDGICNRTPQVRDEIVAVINAPDQSPTPPSPPVTCSTVTDTQLGAITRLELNDRTLIDDTDDITELKAGDFAGLTGLTFLNLSGNKLTTSKLPSNIFSGLTNLEVLGLSSNDLTELPAGIFSGLTNLTGVAVGHNPNLFDPSLLTLTVTPKLISESMAVIEVAPGIPFTKVTANLTIHGGTFSGGMRTMKNVKIEQGETQSAPFAYTADGSSTVVITLSKLRSDPKNILNGFNYKTNEGYTGFELAKGYTYTLAIKGGICNRTPQVRDEIVAMINDPGQSPTPPSPLVTCATVTDTQLAAIKALRVNDPTLTDDTDDITELKAGDFAGLTGLTFLDLSGNKLTTSKLPSNIFSGLTNLEFLGLSSNDLTELPAGIFSGLTNLTGVAVGNNPNLFDSSTLPLTVTPKLISETMAVIEVAPGIPFTKVMANLTIRGGTFSDGTLTMKDVKIEQGETQSAPFAYTADDSSTVVITLSKLRSDPKNILNGFNSKTNEGYTGFELAKGDTLANSRFKLAKSDTLVIGDGICNRTPQVRDEIVAVINDPGQSPTPPSPPVTCSTVTDTQLGAITRLELNDRTLIDDTDDITELKAGDFAGLTGLTFLDLSGNKLTTSKLPSNIFSGLTNLEVLGLSSNDLTELPAGIFSGLTNLTGVAVGHNPNLFDPSLLTLTVTPKLISESMAVIEVAPGIPFTKVTANLTIHGGTFSGGMRTMKNVKIEQGETQSAPFAYTADGSSTVVITLSKLRSDPKNILNGFNYKTNEGYTGFELAKGYTYTLAIKGGICNRTPQVRDEIVAMINDPGQSPTPPSPLVTCATVTDTQLAAIKALRVNDPTLTDDTDDITELKAGDFAGLTGLTFLDLSGNKLTTSKLPSNIFSGLTNLEFLGLSSNDLTELPAGIFSGLTNLTGVAVGNNPNLFDSSTLLLTVTPKLISESMAVIEVAPGIPFTKVTANLTIRGGTFSDGTLTMDNVKIEQGETQSAPFAYTADGSSTVVITLSKLRSDPKNILNGFNSKTNEGYTGFELAKGDTLDIRGGICDRTDAVENAIIDAINAMPMFSDVECDDVTNAQLMGITSLDLSGDLIVNGVGLQSGDFAGLTGLTELILSSNALEVADLPAGIFSDLENLRTLDLSDNDLTSLPEGVFAGLTMLTGVDASGNNPLNDSSDFTLTLELRETGMNSFVIEVVEGAPTRLTVTIMVEGGTASSMTATIETGMLESDEITVTLGEESTEVMVTLTDPRPDLSASAEYSGLVIEVSPDPLAFTFGTEERLEEVGESILPTLSRELISEAQTVISGRIGRLTTSPLTTSPTAQVAGHSTLSDLLLFSAQTFDRVHNQDQSFALETLLQETSFALPFNGEEEDTSRTGFESLAVWGSVDYQNVSGGDDISWDGEITSFHIGSDMRVTPEVLGGVAVSWSQGEFDYEDRTGMSRQEGEYDLELWSVHPYGGWSPSPWLNLWVIGGYGFGEVTVKDNAGSQSSDVQSYSGSLGVSAERDLEENSVLPGITTVRVKAQTSITTMEIEDNGQTISNLTTEAYQQRVSVEVSHTSGGNEERYFIPTLEVGVRNDGGDGETGNGLEIGGDVEYRAMDLGLRVSVNGRWLAVHSGELEEWGVGGSVRFGPGGVEGLWVSITPEWGEMGSRARELWDAKIEDVERVSEEREARLSGEVGYGLSIGKASLTPSAGVSLTNQGYRSYRLGSGVVLGEFSLTLEGERRSTGSVSSEESILLEGSLRF